MDVGKASGTETIDIANVAAHDCHTYSGINAGADIGNDAVFATPASNWPSDLAVYARHGAAGSVLNLGVCNPTSSPIDPPATVFQWVAFDF